MTRPSMPPLEAERLLEHAQWMRRLAHSLVGDGERADELSQQTWVRILEHPPGLERPFRGWIATVMRNVMRAEHRGSARRRAREESSARREAEPSSLELLERASLQRELVQAVLELEEPYRTTVLLRYFEDRTPREIAARERVPLATVKTRLARGIERLRGRLARARTADGRSSVLLALAQLELPAPGPSSIPWTPLALAMKTKLLVASSLLAAGLVYYFYPRPVEHELAVPESAPVLQLARTEHAAEPRAPEVAPRATRERVSAEPVEVRAEPLPRTPPSTPGTRGRVIDADGVPVADVAVGSAADERRQPDSTEAGSLRPLARTAADGSFELPGTGHGYLHVLDPRWTTILAGVPVDQRSGQECRIVVAQRLVLGGLLLASDGAPLEGARISLLLPEDLRPRLAHVLDFSTAVEFVVSTDAEGRFHFSSAPAFVGGKLQAELAPYRVLEEPAPLTSREDLVLVLTRPDEASALLAGTVVDRAGSAVADALVALGLETTRSDELGRFSFRLDDPESFNRTAARFLTVPDDSLRALKPGFLPAELRAPARDPEGRPRWPTPLVLVLGDDSLSIAGRVVDERGEPLPGRRVWIADPTLFGNVSGGSDRERALGFVQVEAILGGQGPGWNWVDTDGEGRFELHGLTEREYAVASMDPATLLRVVRRVLAGRRDVVLTLPASELFERLAGRVLDSRGRPVAHASIFPMCDAVVTRLAGTVLGTQHERAPGTTTDEDGRFVLERVPKDLVYLRIQGPDTIPLEWGREVEGGLERMIDVDPEELVITVEQRCHFRVELAVPAEADQLGMLDADGNVLVISEFLGHARNDTERHALVDGRSSTLAVGDRAAFVVLYRDGFEVRRAPVRLASGPAASLRL